MKDATSDFVSLSLERVFELWQGAGGAISSKTVRAVTFVYVFVLYKAEVQSIVGAKPDCGALEMMVAEQNAASICCGAILCNFVRLIVAVCMYSAVMYVCGWGMPGIFSAAMHAPTALDFIGDDSRTVRVCECVPGEREWHNHVRSCA